MGNILEPQHAMKELSNESTPLEFTYNKGETDIIISIIICGLGLLEVPRSRDMMIFVLISTTTTMTQPITLPLAHACRVKMYYLYSSAYST